MIAALNQSKVRSSLRPDVLRPLLAKYPQSVQKAGETLLASLTEDTANQLRRLEELLPAIQGGDVIRGQAVFNNPKVACFSCHAIGYMTAAVKELYDRRIADGLVPEGRWGQPDDVGRAVCALLRGDLPYATGSVIHLDGGLSLPRL